MKNLPKDIHVEALTEEHGKEIIETFKKLGVHTAGYSGVINRKDGNNTRFYGLVNGCFSNRLMEEAENIVTLEELKSYLEDIPELPNGTLMYVSDNPISEASWIRKRFVIGKKGDRYLAWDGAETLEGLEGIAKMNSWKYAVPITEPKEITMTVAEIEEKLGITNLKIVK